MSEELNLGRTFRASINEGMMHFRDPELVGRWLKKFEGQLVAVSIRRYFPPRSDGQNRYFHGIVLPMFAEESGMDLDEAKQALKMKFLPVYIGEGENRIQTCRGTSTLDVGEFTKFIEDCRRLAAEMFQLDIPDPE